VGVFFFRFWYALFCLVGGFFLLTTALTSELELERSEGILVVARAAAADWQKESKRVSGFFVVDLAPGESYDGLVDADEFVLCDDLDPVDSCEETDFCFCCFLEIDVELSDEDPDGKDLCTRCFF
jgi:hypothetical protein